MLTNIPGAKPLKVDRVSPLPQLTPPAGYVLLIKDVEYGNRYKIDRVQKLERHLLKRGADLPFETQLALILKADNAAAAERALRKELAWGAELGDWFDLEDGQLQQLQNQSAPRQPRQNPRRRPARQRSAPAPAPPPPRAANRPNQPAAQPTRRRTNRGRKIASLLIIALLIYALYSMITGRNLATEIIGRLEPALHPTATSAATPTDIPPTALPSATPTHIPPTATPSNTPTVIPPSATPSATPTDILPTAPPSTTPTVILPTAPPSATLTVIPPTATPTVIPPTATPSATPTVIPPTATYTSSPTVPPPSATLTVIPPTATALAPTQYIVETANNLNAHIRACPRTSCDIVAKLPAGALIEVVNAVTGETVNDINSWYEIELAGDSAYIHSQLAELAPQTQPSAPNFRPVRYDSPRSKYTHSSVNIREGPSTDYPVLGFAPPGATLEVIGRSGDWYLIRHIGREVYIAAWLTHDAPPPPAQAAQSSGNQNPANPPPAGQNAVAVHVVDGDTIDVRLDGETIRLRYIGVDTPERGDPCYAEATNYNRSLVQGKTLTLVRDVSDYGPYGRLLRYVYADGVFVNLALVQAGYAEASYYAPNGKHRREFEAAERSAPNRNCHSVPAQSSLPQPIPQQPAPQIDNCCFIGWKCNSEDEWKAGFFAYQNNQCDKSPPPANSSQSQPSSQSYSCNCSKTCGQISSCSEAKFQLNSCGCSQRDEDGDGTPCESLCR